MAKAKTSTKARGPVGIGRLTPPKAKVKPEPKGEYLIYDAYGECLGDKYSSLSEAISAAQNIMESDGEGYPSLRILKLVANIDRMVSVKVTVHP